MATDLTIVIVSWNVAPLLRACLDAILQAPDVSQRDGQLWVGHHRAEIWVVDSASSDGTAAMVREHYPQVQLIACETNVGFSAGNNLALRRCDGRYLLLLNPDTEIVDDALSSMLHYMERHPDIGVLGPQLRYPDGRPQPSRRRFPTLAMALMESTLLEQWLPNNRWARAYRFAETPGDVIQPVDWVTGACMLVRRKAVERVGLLDEDLFMYSEELDWCRRLTDDGWHVIYYPCAVVVHHEGQSAGQVTAARDIYFHSSKIHYFRKHHGRLQAEVLRAFLLATYVVQMGREALKLAIGHRPAMRRRRLAAYLQVLRSGLRRPRRTAAPCRPVDADG
jgi:N-acetylglucosaminyl-diphospho-decaprenol L-rhamnosyltransferase